MTYEYSTERGLLRLVKSRSHWTIEFSGQQAGAYPTAEAAAAAAARHASGLSAWDKQESSDVSPDILDWRPTGDSI